MAIYVNRTVNQVVNFLFLRTRNSKGGKMTISKETRSLGMSWEKEYGYSQAVKVENTIFVSGQVSHDDNGNIVGLGRYGGTDAASLRERREGARTVRRNDRQHRR